MRAWRKTLFALFALGLMALSFPATARADEHSAFIELSTGDLTDFEIWEDSHFSPVGDVCYNRVDGLLLYMGAQYRSESRLHPRLKAMWGWPSSRSDSYYQLDIEQPVHSQDSFLFGVNLYNKSASSLEDEETVSDFGNNLQAFSARIDERDYFRRDGVTVFAQHKATPQLTLRGEYRSDRLSSLSEQQSVWSVFGRNEDWRENPQLMVGVLAGAREFEGRMSSYVLSAEYDSRDEDATTGWWARGISEYGGTAAGGDYKFRKSVLEATRIFTITSTQTLAVSGMWGLSNGTDFPSHKLFHLGGRGNLRGYDYKEFSGKDTFFGRAEYKVRVTEPLEIVYYLESGQVGYSTSTPESDDSDGHKHDVGIGFLVEAPWAGWIRLDVAKAMEEEAEIKTYLSLLLMH
ncbi:MAG: BamA/TamA family outer membrane protein [Candidatus Eisenbacteria sp.]|nr:BamA/TamA family outer membrane protein [Candidatus Eisenbacteria bacterium]